MKFGHKQPKDGHQEGKRKLSPQYDPEPLYTDGNGLKTYQHCKVCEATWTEGQWKPLDEHTIAPAYLGGFLFYVSPRGYNFAYRCRCAAGKQKGTHIPDAPDWLWLRVQDEGKLINDLGKIAVEVPA